MGWILHIQKVNRESRLPKALRNTCRSWRTIRKQAIDQMNQLLLFIRFIVSFSRNLQFAEINLGTIILKLTKELTNQPRHKMMVAIKSSRQNPIKSQKLMLQTKPFH
jgi:hypothetical protein